MGSLWLVLHFLWPGSWSGQSSLPLMWVFVDQQSPQPQLQPSLVQVGSWISEVLLMPKKASLSPSCCQSNAPQEYKNKKMPFSFLAFAFAFKLLITRYQGSKFMCLFSRPIAGLREWIRVFYYSVLPVLFSQRQQKGHAIPDLFWLLSKAKLLITSVGTAPFPLGIEEYVENGKGYSEIA